MQGGARGHSGQYPLALGDGAAAQERCAEFPDLSPSVDALLYRIGLVSLRLRGLWPAGTSLLAVARRRP